MYNKIINDFNEDGLEIDISTPSYPNRTILIDRDVYNGLEGKISANGSKYVIITVKGKPTYLGRYLLDIPSGDKRLVYHVDGLWVDYRLHNLRIFEKRRSEPVQFKNFDNSRNLADIYKVQDIKHILKPIWYRNCDKYSRARMDANVEEYLEERELSLEQIRVRQSLEYIEINNEWMTVYDYVKSFETIHGDYVRLHKVRGCINIPTK